MTRCLDADQGRHSKMRPGLDAAGVRRRTSGPARFSRQLRMHNFRERAGAGNLSSQLTQSGMPQIPTDQIEFLVSNVLESGCPPVGSLREKAGDEPKWLGTGPTCQSRSSKRCGRAATGPYAHSERGDAWISCSRRCRLPLETLSALHGRLEPVADDCLGSISWRAARRPKGQRV
jgi:hypothetical protein